MFRYIYYFICFGIIVISHSQEMGIGTNNDDIHTFYPLLTFGNKKDYKIILQFTCCEAGNEFYERRKTVAGRKISSLGARS